MKRVVNNERPEYTTVFTLICSTCAFMLMWILIRLIYASVKYVYICCSHIVHDAKGRM